MFIRKNVFGVIIFLLAISSISASAGNLKSRFIPEKSEYSILSRNYDNRHIEVKFKDGLDIGFDNQNSIIDRSGTVFQDKDSRKIFLEILKAGGIWIRMTGEQEFKADEMRQTAEQYHGREIADLNNYFILSVPENVESIEWITILNSLTEIELAKFMPLPIAPPVPNYQSNQGYLNPAFDGINAQYAWNFPGGNGSNVIICDVEYSWNLNHDDLPAGIPTWVQTGYSPRDPFNNNDHGTAVLGELASLSNGWGTTGASYGANIVVAPSFLKPLVGDSAWYLSVAMANAMYNLSGGDVMLIEQQMAGPNWSSTTGDTGLIPVEWDLTIYNLVQTITGNGIHVVEAAGNGYQSLDLAIYNTGHAPFAFGNHSGAIIVGAGAVPSAFGGSTTDRSRLSFSNYGTRVDLQGWGEAVYTTGYGTFYNAEGVNREYTATFNGTSSASPNIASAVALISSINEIVNGFANPITPDRMIHLLRFTGSLQTSGIHFPWEIIGNRPDLKAAIDISGIIDTLYFKAGYTDYCPNGMPDFSMHLDSAWRGYSRWTFDGPAALANCLWWFDSKFETSPVDPRPFNGSNNDNYPLVKTYGTWDDHDTANVKPFIQELANIMTTSDTTGPLPGFYDYGTKMSEMAFCVDSILRREGLRGSFTDTIADFPTFQYIKDQLVNSQNVILEIGFYNADPNYCCRYGGHYVNLVGIDSTKKRIAISDPYTAFANGYDIQMHRNHIDAGIKEYEVYQLANISDPGCVSDGSLYMTDYHSEWFWSSFESINDGWNACGGSTNDSAHAVIERALIICPTDEPSIDTCTYYKASYDDYAPNGLPDFDQKQVNWKSPLTGSQFYSWCGPVALANCLWWFDSKYESSPVDPRPFYPGPGQTPVNDQYSLVQSTNIGVWDDHDTTNVQPFITYLKSFCNTDGYQPGTYIVDLMNGFNNYLSAVGLTGAYSCSLVPGPSFDLINDSITSGKNVILLLGFYEPAFSTGCIRHGGHYVTVAGVCDEETDLCISDPYFDINETSAHGGTIQNDASLVSGPHGTKHHDRYHLENYTHSCPTPATERITDYNSNWSALVNFVQQNTFNLALPPGGFPEGNPIVTLVDYALIISPVSSGCDCIPGDANNNGVFNILDITYLIAHLYKGGPAPAPYPLCSGDANCNCVVNILDITYLISYLYKFGPAPCTCEQWLINCGEPLRK
ncbi:MAG: S8 family serine peptidase [Candidatus Zixiibacteriota bacterium]